MTAVRILLRLAGIAVLLAGAFAFFALGVAALELRRTLAILPQLVRQEATLTRQLADQTVTAALTVAQTEIHGTSRALQARLASVERVAASEVQAQGQAVLEFLDARIAQALADLDARMRDTNASIAQVAAVGPPVRIIAERMQEVVEIGTDCEASPNCWQNASHSLVRAWKESAEETAKALPEITVSVVKVANEAPATAAAVRGITEDAHAVTAEFVRPKRLTEKLWAAIKAAGGLAILATK